ncbi:MAG TPA: glucose-6-phosphate dehydrogenase assembly protein OpcA [Pyrinomonadaceae bacterium]|nr:glucose-6-phosphate dehydrogenase assembly protein OpcA [Pyrinomonadaceae bacterium]
METQGERAASAGAKGIDAARLERELTAMWRANAVTGADGAPTGMTRACVLNLVVYTSERDDRTALDAVLDEVFERNPCRALILRAGRAEEPASIKAYVSTRCQAAGRGRKLVCGEQVTIEARGRAVETAGSAVAPLLVPDVPVFLWWKDVPHYEDNLFDRLVGMADRVVIDSASFDHPRADLLRLAHLVGERTRFNLSDLNWCRLASWRTLVASFWDVADYRAYLDRIERVEIEYTWPEGAALELAPKAALTLGWMASALKWEIEPAGTSVENRETRFLLRAGERRIDVTARAQPDAGAHKSTVLTALKLTAPDAEFHVAFRPEGTKLETGTRIGADRHVVGRVLAYEPRSEGARLNEELSFLTRDRVYERSLNFAARLLDTLRS